MDATKSPREDADARVCKAEKRAANADTRKERAEVRAVAEKHAANAAKKKEREEVRAVIVKKKAEEYAAAKERRLVERAAARERRLVERAAAKKRTEDERAASAVAAARKEEERAAAMAAAKILTALSAKTELAESRSSQAESRTGNLKAELQTTQRIRSASLRCETIGSSKATVTYICERFGD